MVELLNAKHVFKNDYSIQFEHECEMCVCTTFFHARATHAIFDSISIVRFLGGLLLFLLSSILIIPSAPFIPRVYFRFFTVFLNFI